MYSCRRVLFSRGYVDSWLESNKTYFCRFRSGADLPRRRPRVEDGRNDYPSQKPPNGRIYRPPRPVSQNRPQVPTRQKSINTYALIEDSVTDWSNLPHVRRRLERFGIQRRDIHPLISAFAKDVSGGLLATEEQREKYETERLVISASETNRGHRIDQVLTQLLYTWASDPKKQRTLPDIISKSTLKQIEFLYAAADMSYPADLYPKARSICRTVIMHVGPTNSGKTHMALRALAAARVGIYAGPLRLLAHEIWERLNRGQIVPLGMDPDDGSEADTSLTADVSTNEESRPTVRKDGNPKYARDCNLRTGEEIRVVSDSAGLMSCTVEMMTETDSLDVAVVDEIQMIADPDRGSGWTHAVLGLPAKELHLCGEETAIPIIEGLLKVTGDKLIIKRYERLTPLTVQEESLEGDLSRIQKGDCVVTFSRSGIFALKQQVEKATGLRCAVAYGRLPPEIRSEQASLFNDPNSGYDVIIGSDAIGMGLNLKIKRVVFETVHKYDGHKERMLSISQIKQIAGRAGRYGLHGEPGGFVTTLHPNDLPILKSALSIPADPLPGAGVVMKHVWQEAVSQALPPDSSTLTLYEVASFVAKVRPPCQPSLCNRLDEMTSFVDNIGKDLIFKDKILLMSAPISWADPMFMDVVKRMVHIYQTEIRVGIHDMLRNGPYLPMLTEVEDLMVEQNPRSAPPSQGLQMLETLHKVLVLYMWLSTRNAMSYYQRDETYDLKVRTEHSLQWCLEKHSKLRKHIRSEFAMMKTEAGNKIDYRSGPKNVDSDAGRIRGLQMAEALAEKTKAR